MVSNIFQNQSIITPINLNKLLYKKYSNIKEEFHVMNINSIISDKNSRLNSKYKDYLIQDYFDEFLKKFYSTNESKEKLSKLFKYYKNYLKFFCKPCLNNFSNNKIIQKHCEDHAEAFYKINYNINNQPENKNLFLKNNSLTRNSPHENFEIFFDTMVRKSLAKEEDNIVSGGITIEAICQLIKENHLNEKKKQFDADIKKKIELRLREIYKSDKSDEFNKFSYKSSKETNLKNNIGASARNNFWNKKRNSLIENDKEKLELIKNKKNLENLVTYKPKKKINIKESERNFIPNESLRGKNNLEQKYIPCNVEKNNFSFNKLLENLFKNSSYSSSLLLDKKNNIIPDRKISIEKLSHLIKKKSLEKANSNQFRLNNKIKNYLNSSITTAVVFKKKYTLNKVQNASSSQYDLPKNSSSSRFFININQSKNIKSKNLSAKDNIKIPLNIQFQKESNSKTQINNKNKSCQDDLKKLKSKTENSFLIQILRQSKTQTKIINDDKHNNKVFNKLEANKKSLYKSSSRDNTNTIKMHNNKIYKEKSKEKKNIKRINEMIVPIGQNVKTQRYNSLG